jgi:hypothetical protein
MRPGVIIALTASLVVVGWATWYRHVSSLGSTPSLAAISREDVPQAYYDELTAQFKAASTKSVAPTDTEPLTTTDLIGRQLVSDYLELTQNGQASGNNLEKLGERYAQSLSQLTQAQQITVQDITIVETSPESLNAYMIQLSSIYQKYAPAFTRTPESSAIKYIAQKNFEFVSHTAQTYKEQADELNGLPVPAALVQSHIQLVNANLLNAAAFEAAAQMDTDPAVGLAGIITVSQNAAREGAVLNQMIAILQGK